MAGSLEWKDRGNAAFKESDYAAAIRHYTQAILLDRQSPTFHLNRAAAYLKLGKNTDAENDCTRALEIDAKLAKGYFRRAQARIFLDKLQDAHADLKHAIQLEPTDNTVAQEIKKVETLIETKKERKRTVDIKPPTPQRRRVPIKIVDTMMGPIMPEVVKDSTVRSSATTATKRSDVLLDPVETRRLAVTKPEKASSDSFQELKNNREETKPSRVAGGIFRSSGHHTLFERPAGGTAKVNETGSDSTTMTSASRNLVPSDMLGERVTTLLDFTRLWELLSAQDRYTLITGIAPQRFRSILGKSLEANLLVSILETLVLKVREDQQEASAIIRVMNGLSQVPRMDTLILFLNENERAMLNELVTILGSGILDKIWQKAEKI